MEFKASHSGQLPYWEGGSTGDGHPILFLHGWGVAPWVYGSVLKDLSQQFPVIAPCLPGLCWTRSRTRITSHEDLARLVAHFCDAKGITRAHVVGQSTGGGIAASLAALRPSLVQSLVLIDTTGTGGQTVLGTLRGIVFDVILRRLDVRFALSHLRIIGSLVRNMLSAREQLVQVAIMALREDLSPAFAGLTMPTMILWGQCDLLFPLRRAYRLQAQIAGAELRIARSGEHLWSLCRQREAARYILEFVQRWPHPAPIVNTSNPPTSSSMRVSHGRGSTARWRASPPAPHRSAPQRCSGCAALSAAPANPSTMHANPGYRPCRQTPAAAAKVSFRRPCSSQQDPSSQALRPQAGTRRLTSLAHGTRMIAKPTKISAEPNRRCGDSVSPSTR
jgi:pimeloyl-ACP methyl ester carboxylesterase